MPNYTRKMECKPTSDIKRFRDITINAFQTSTNQVNSLSFNDATQFTAFTGTNSTYTGNVLPKTAQVVSSSFPFYDNVDNPGDIYGTSQGRTLIGVSSATQQFVNNYLLNDIQELVLLSDTANKEVEYVITDGTSTSTATIKLPLANTIYRVIYKPNIVGVQAPSNQALGATVAGTALLLPSTTVKLNSIGTGNVTVFDTYTTSWHNNLPGSVLSASICCQEEITKETSKDKTDRTCSGVKKGEIITKEESKWTVKVKEIDLNSMLIFTGSQLSFKTNTIGKKVFSSLTPTGSGNIVINIGTNRKISQIKVGTSVIQLITSLNNLQPNQGNYNSTSGDLTLNGSYHSNQLCVVTAGNTQSRLQMLRRALKSGYKFYIEVPEYFEDGEIRTANFYAEILDFKIDFIKDNDTEYTLEFLEIPNTDNDYVTTIE